ncbi:Epsin-3, clathrin recruitment and traffic between the Golgi and endosome [Coemansia sp. IMI 209127]|nr:Epsin-3, clathrin recruitment and traffic between the Golgi and endosome [Coemansia sp. IMI 209127]
MDLGKLTEISVWDVRNVYNRVKNVVLNLSEVEIKVNEATGPEPWGASSTLMREIADATHDSFEDIMAAIYLKINDTDPGSWRQVYKALQLVEYLVKNGSERVVDDVRGHITIIKTLKNFHHIDAAGKDQGINVRHRSKEIVELVQNKDRLRDDRKNAKANRHKFESSGGGGFGSYGGYSGDGYTPSSSARDAYGSDSTGSKKSTPVPDPVSAPSSSRNSSRQRFTEPSRPAEPVVADLFSFDDDEIETPLANVNTNASVLLPAPMSAPAVTASASAAPPAIDDDWGDFQGGDNGISSINKPADNGSGKAVDLLGDINVGPNTQPMQSLPATRSPPPPAAGKAAKAAPPAATKPSDKKAAFSDIWDVNSNLLSLDSLSLAQKGKSGEKGSGSGKQMSMNQLANKQMGGF